MSEPIYKVYIGRYTDVWYQLTKDERRALVIQVSEALEQLGGRSVIDCHSEWASDQWHWFGIEEYPNLEAVQQYADRLKALEWYRYIQVMSVLGTKWEMA